MLGNLAEKSSALCATKTAVLRAISLYTAAISLNSGEDRGLDVLVMAAFDPEKRALHDRICETRVIYSR